MQYIESARPIRYTDLLRGLPLPEPAACPEQSRRKGRKPYTPPTIRDIGTLDELVFLRDRFAQAAPALLRLAGNTPFIQLAVTTHSIMAGYDDHVTARAAEIDHDLTALLTLFRDLNRTATSPPGGATVPSDDGGTEEGVDPQ